VDVIQGLTAVVTGGGSGIGRSICLALARRGVNVAVVDLDGAAAADVEAEVKELGVSASAHSVDVSKLDQVEALADACYDRFGSVEILVNNAGVTLRPFRSSWNTDIADFAWTMSINYWGVIHGHHAFVPRMLATAGAKHIVNTTSMATVTTIAGHSAYSASKAAVDAFSLCARAELESYDIGVSILHPGRIRTRISASERFREAGTRSEDRNVQAWVDPLHPPSKSKVEAIAAADDSGAPEIAQEPMDMISPKRVGVMVVRGIEVNAPRILTHPAPVDTLEARMRDIVEGYRVPDGSE
jgi:NAD(P)-dependent dehydrogenase (short-subunit alcohol dehydrogenase family)